jgi:uncharacterized protein with gpF-like domain
MQKHLTPQEISTLASGITFGDWSHVRETVNMLCLAVCQIEATLADGNSSVDKLIQSFTTVASHNNELSQKILSAESPSDLKELKVDITETVSSMNAHLNSSIQSFQFYDRICQRLDHVARSLEKVSDVMNDAASLHEPQAWRRIQNDIKDSYTMAAERIMFEHIMEGGSIKDALRNYHQHFNQPPPQSRSETIDIELF